MQVGIVSAVPFPERAVFAREQARALAELAHDVTVFSPVDPTSRWPVPRLVDVVDVDWTTEPAQLSAAVKEAAPDVLHIQSPTGLVRLPPLDVPAVVELLSASLRRAPARQSVHLVSAVRLRHLAVGCANPRIVGGAWRPADFHAPNGYSSWASGLAERRRCTPATSGLFVHQGTTSPLRRFDQLLEAFALLHRERPHTRLCFVGGSETRQIRRATRRLGLSDHVDVLQSRDPEPLLQCLTSAVGTVAWVPPGRGFDGQPPLKILDSLAAGIPQIVTATEANRDLLQAGGGIVAEARSSAFAQAWIEFTDRLDAGHAFELQDREAFLQERSWTTIMEHIWVPRYRAAAS